MLGARISRRKLHLRLDVCLSLFLRSDLFLITSDSVSTGGVGEALASLRGSFAFTLPPSLSPCITRICGWMVNAEEFGKNILDGQADFHLLLWASSLAILL